jgi:hypothetical protein
MLRLDVRVVRAWSAAFAAWAVMGCNSILGIEEPPQAPADAEVDGGTGNEGGGLDVATGDAPLEDVMTTDGAADGSVADAAAGDAPADSGAASDVSPDGPSDVADASIDGFDATDPSDATHDADAARSDAPTDGARPDGDAGRVDSDARPPDATPPRPDGPIPKPDGIAPPEITLTLTVTKDQDDATWINNTDERLHYDMDSFYLEVGADTEAGKAGLRFELPVPPGSIINSAIIQLFRTIGDALPDESMKVQVYDSPNVPPFDDAHTHAPEAHAAGGLWPTFVGPIWVGENGKAVQTSELKQLVQHVVDRSDWVAGSAIGFVFSAQTMGVRWVDFADSSLSMNQPYLQLNYTPP